MYITMKGLKKSPPPGGSAAVTDCGPDPSPGHLWLPGRAPHALPALPALHLPQDGGR